MPDIGPSFESSDIKGSTNSFRGSVGLTYVAIPSSSGDPIHELMVENRSKNTMELSFTGTGETEPVVIDAGGNFSWAPKGSITQIHLKADKASSDYQIVMNRSNE